MARYKRRGHTCHTAESDAYLVEHYATETTRMIADELGMHTHAISDRAARLRTFARKHGDESMLEALATHPRERVDTHCRMWHERPIAYPDVPWWCRIDGRNQSAGIEV